MVWQDVPSSSLLMTVPTAEDRSAAVYFYSQLYLAMLLPLTIRLQGLKARKLRLGATRYNLRAFTPRWRSVPLALVHNR
jgi:hypothetical protein